MNSSILVTGLIAVGVGAMTIFFYPFGSSEKTSEVTRAYQAGKANSNVVKDSSLGIAPTTSSAAPGVSTTTNDAGLADAGEVESFGWEDLDDTGVTTDLVNDLNDSKATTTQQADELAAFDTISRSGGSGLVDPVDEEFSFDQSGVSSVDEDLDSFYGPTDSSAKVAATAAGGDSPRDGRPTETDSAYADSVGQTSDARFASKSANPTAVKSSQGMFTFAPKSGSENKGNDAGVANDKARKMVNQGMSVPESLMGEKGNTARVDGEFPGSLQPVPGAPATVKSKVYNIKITNPVNTGLTVTFLANDQKIALRPNQSYVVSNQIEKVDVKFSRGGTFGYAQESLGDGEYRFSVSREAGWKLAQ